MGSLGQAATSSPGADYLKWACSELFKLLESEKVNRANSRRDAHATTAFVVVPFGFYVTLVKQQTTLSGWEKFWLVLLSLAVAGVLFTWARVMWVRVIGSFDRREFMRYDVQDDEGRYDVLFNHLRVCLAASERVRGETGKWRRWNMRMAVPAILLATLLVTLRIYNGL